MIGKEIGPNSKSAKMRKVLSGHYLALHGYAQHTNGLFPQIRLITEIRGPRVNLQLQTRTGFHLNVPVFYKSVLRVDLRDHSLGRDKGKRDAEAKLHHSERGWEWGTNNVEEDRILLLVANWKRGGTAESSSFFPSITFPFFRA